MVAMEDTQFFRTDCKSVWSQIKHQKKQIQLKRRWLLGLPMSESKQKKSKSGYIFDSRSLPESLIREDDIFYDTVKSCVEEAFGVRRYDEFGHQVGPDSLDPPDMADIPRIVLSCRDNLTTKGLCLIAKVLAGGRTKVEKTRWKMKKVIRESLLVVFGGRSSNSDNNLKEISRQLARILNDPRNFRDNHVPFLTSRLLIQRAAAKNILGGLENFPCQTLIVMHKKLKEVKQSMPQLQPRRNGWNRDYLVNQVRKNSEKMLSELGREDQLPGPLAKAMAVAALSLKLMPGFHNSSAATDFHQFSNETKVLQNEITKAIWLVKTKVGIAELKNVKDLLDPNAKVSNRSLRTATRKMLTEYLFGCGDLDMVPKSLFEALAMINKKSRRIPDSFIVKNAIDEEIECILNVSAHAKQNLLNLLPAVDFDVDFTDAYMEDLEESDDEFDYGDDNCDNDDEMELHEDNISQGSSSNQEVESTGDSSPIDSKLPTATNNAEETRPAADEKISSNVHVGGLETNGEQTAYKNQYLAHQDVCDEICMVAYSLIGGLLEAFGHKEGLDWDWYCSLYLRRDCIKEEEDSQVTKQKGASKEESDGTTLVRVTEELIPSFPKRGTERLRRMLGS